MSENAFESLGLTGEQSDSVSRRLAIELERSRLRLASCLINNPGSALFIAEQLAIGRQNNGNFIASNNSKAVSAFNQPPDKSALQLLQCELENLHLMPLFLLNIAGILFSNASSKTFSLGYKRKLEKYRLDLQVNRQKMISANLGLVGFAAGKYTASNLGLDDLMQEGILGLIKAVDRFDPYRGICFSTYGMYWIRQAISRLIYTQDKIVRLPIPLAEKAYSVFEAMRNCYLQYERWPTVDELKQACGLPEHEITTISSYYQATHSLDTDNYSQADSRTLLEKMPQQQFNSPLEQLLDENLAAFLNKALASLPEKQAAILSMRFGLLDQTEMTLQAIADRLHLTRERVRQIQNQALKKLNQQFGCDLLTFMDAGDSSK